jgi:hypothetical protein
VLARASFCLVACLLIISPWLVQHLHSQQPSLPSIAANSTNVAATSSGNIITAVQSLPSGYLQVVVVDSQARSMATYHVEPDTGGIVLKSVRNIEADLLLKDFNGSAPAPDEVRAVIQPR